MASSRLGASEKAAVAIAVVLTLVAVAIDNAAVGWLLGVPITLLLFWFATRVPVIYSLVGVMFCAFSLENPSEATASGQWRSPLYVVGALLLAHMNQVTGVSFMSISGTDMFLIFLIGVVLQRRASKSKIDGGWAPTPKPLIDLAKLSLAGAMFVWGRGLIAGGDFSKSLWQIEKVTYLPITFLLFQYAVRGPKDYLLLGRTVITAALVKAAVAVYVMHFADVGPEKPPWATSHHDSMLFACAVVILVAVLIHKAHPRAGRLALTIFPPICWGMIENNRRMVWVQIALVFLTLFFSMPPTRAKKKIVNALLYASPFIALYIAAGWGSPTGIFKPVGTIRSVVEPANDVSTMTRDIENYDLAMTIRSNPLFGLGYGHQYLQIIGLPPMPHPLEPWLPHNSLLGLWFASGFVGYTMITLLWTGGVYFGVRAYRALSNPMDRAAALVSFGAVLIYMIQCYGDLGLGAWTGVYIVAPSIAVAGKLAVISGAWPMKGRHAKGKLETATPPQAAPPPAGPGGPSGYAA
ncbi:MAG TPA: hypothetical protein VFQ61_32905 [Polyangiaceae bacterium]|nr:hypothetical protein [Polyangiaceae bacterium]